MTSARKLLLHLFLFILLGPGASPLAAQERTIGEGEHKGFIVNEGEQAWKIGPVKPGQTVQVFFTPHWSAEAAGRAECRLEDPGRTLLRAAARKTSEVETALLEWTSNSQPRPESYLLRILGQEGANPAEILGQYTLQVYLWDQNDGDAGTDAPESYEKALLLPVSEAGNYSFEECFISGTADLYDIYKFRVKPNHTLGLKAKPLEWRAAGRQGKVRFEFLNKSFRKLKGAENPLGRSQPFALRVFHPRLKGDPKPALFYLLVKAEGEVSLIYSLEIEMREGR